MFLRHRALTVVMVLSLAMNGLLIFRDLRKDTNEAIQKRVDSQKLISPYLSHRILFSDNDMLINFTPLRESLKQYVGSLANTVGVYFEYLPSGSSIGVNDQLEVEIASLAKVPAVMAIYLELERGKIELSEVLTIQESDLDTRFGELGKKGAGTKLTVEEAIDMTLKKSDNTAANALIKLLPQGALDRVFDNLDLARKRTGPFPVLSPKGYTSVLRNLYLASFVNEESSNAILSKLTQTDYSDKLPAGVPSDVPIAHKIGVFNKSDGINIYSDCGIFYVPNRPYSLCVMVSDESEDLAREEIVLVSKMVYGYVIKSSPQR